jgi:hypothetical protein
MHVQVDEVVVAEAAEAAAAVEAARADLVEAAVAAVPELAAVVVLVVAAEADVSFKPQAMRVFFYKICRAEIFDLC